MGMFRHLVVTAALSATLTACDSEAATPPPISSHSAAVTTLATPTGSPSRTPTPPPMPESAKAQTEEGATAFVEYYAAIITYAESTLDTSPIEAVSLPTCRGCAGGIAALKKLERQGARITGGAVRARSITTSAIDKHGVVSVFFDSVSARESVYRPGKKRLIHPAGRHPWVMTLVWKDSHWNAGQYEARP